MNTRSIVLPRSWVGVKGFVLTSSFSSAHWATLFPSPYGLGFLRGLEPGCQDQCIALKSPAIIVAFVGSHTSSSSKVFSSPGARYTLTIVMWLTSTTQALGVVNG